MYGSRRVQERSDKTLLGSSKKHCGNSQKLSAGVRNNNTADLQGAGENWYLLKDVISTLESSIC